MFARVTNISSLLKTSMPISINNYLISVNLYIGDSEDDTNRIQILVDTRDTMNTENLQYHLLVMF